MKQSPYNYKLYADSYERLMIVGGDSLDSQTENQVEVIDLSGNNQHCPNLQNGNAFLMNIWE